MIIYSPTFTGSVQITGSQTVTGDLTVQGNLTAQTFILSSSVSYFTESFASGSTRFGDSMDDTMVVTGSLRLTGSMGIGVANPGSLVEISKGSNAGSGASFPRLSIKNTLATQGDGSSTFNFADILVSSGNETVNMFLATTYAAGTWAPAAIINVSTNHDLQIKTNNTERMRITSSGGVGIGTTNPSYKLHVSSSTDGFISRFTGGTSGNVNIGIFGSTAGAFGSIGTESNHSFNIFTNGTDRMTISGSSGNVGIGITSPNHKLSIVDSSFNQYSLRVESATGNTANRYGGIGFAGEVNNTKAAMLFVSDGTSFSRGSIVFSNNNAADQTNADLSTERMRITSGGSVGIGTTSSVLSAKLSVMGTITAQSTGVDASYQEAYIAHYSSNPTESNAILTAVSSVAGSSGFQFAVSNGAGSAARTVSMTINRSSVNVVGAISKGSGTFKIDHPLESKKDTNYLVHSFVEGPRADLIYRGKVTLVNGAATINIDETIGMTEGTFVALNRDVQCFTTNESGWDAIKGKVEGNILTITSQNTESTDEISWMVIGERQDEHIKNTEWTDANGKPILEPLKP